MYPPGALYFCCRYIVLVAMQRWQYDPLYLHKQASITRTFRSSGNGGFLINRMLGISGRERFT